MIVHVHVHACMCMYETCSCLSTCIYMYLLYTNTHTHLSCPVVLLSDTDYATPQGGAGGKFYVHLYGCDVTALLTLGSTSMDSQATAAEEPPVASVALY